MEIETQLQRWMAVAICSIIALSSIAGLANSQSDKRIIHATWMDDPPVIDGDLSESAWQKADVATSFFHATQPRGIPANLHTEAMVLYSENTLYIGVYCEEPNISNLRETETRRDSSVWQDDAVEVLLDTYNDQRNSYVFVVNTFNTQMDGKISNESNFDRSWDAKWDAKVQKNGDHWTAEFAIPFRELRFDGEGSTWGINFWRAHPMDSERYSWADTAGNFTRVSEFGRLSGLDLSKVKSEHKIGILPYVTHRALQNQADSANRGLDLIIPVSTNITTNLTFNPDFSQLESDSTRINVSSDRELFLPERRPFFREGAELFELPLDLFYTRRVQEIDYGAKTAGKVKDYNFAIINTYGKMVDRYDDDQKKQANLFAARVNRDIGERTVVGAMGIQKHQVDRDVTMLSFNGKFGLHRDWTARSQYVMDWIDGAMHWAYHTSMNWRNESGWSGNVRLEEIQDGFRPNETGFEDEAFRKTFSRLGYRYRFAKDNLVRSFSVSGYHFYQTNAEKLLRTRRIGWSTSVDIGRFDFDVYGGNGVQRDDGQLFDRKYIGSEISYRPKWGRARLSNRFGTRQEKFSRYTSFSIDANLFTKLTLDLNLNNFFWRDHQNTLVLRLRANYQFTPRLGWRVFVERVDERFNDELGYNFNSIFDYQFTPESHFFFVFVDDTAGDRAVFTKLSYLFESGLPF